MIKTESIYAQFVQKREDQGLKRSLIDIKVNSGLEIEIDGQSYINFSSNDYLGLSQHPSLIKKAQEWTEKYGAGSCASRLVTGNLELFTRLEEKVARFKGKETALIMVSGYQANASVLPALFDRTLLGSAPLVFSDKLNHASMHHGCASAGVQQIRYRHNDMAHLKELLEKHKDSPAPKFILTESVFSMDGDIAPLDEIYVLAKKYNCFTIIDEAHATGVLGENGQGLASKADLIIGTFSKAFGSFGAYIACTQTLKDYLVNKCGGLIYATALPPAVLGAIDAALDIVPTMDHQRSTLQDNAEYFRNQLYQIGCDTLQSQTQIVPMIIGDASQALRISKTLKQNGIWATAIRPPTVPQNAARIRFALSAKHNKEHIDQIINALKSTTLSKAA